MQAPQHLPLAGRGAGTILNSFLATTSSVAAFSSRTSPPTTTTSTNNNNYKNSSSTNIKSVAFSSSEQATELSAAESSGYPSTQPMAVPARLSVGGPQSTTTGLGSLALRVGPRLRAEGLMVPPASDAATLRRQVSALQIDLEAHIDGEQRLQSINHELHERLELYMKQNHENVVKAETELNTLHEDMEQTLELQRRLAHRAQALEKENKEMEAVLQKKVEHFETERSAHQNRIAAMSIEVREKTEVEAKLDALQATLMSTIELKEKLEEKLSGITEEACSLKKRQVEYTKELQNLFLKEQRERKVQQIGKKSFERRMFMRFKEAICIQCIDRSYTIIAEKYNNTNVIRLGWHALRMATGRSSLIKQRNKYLHEHLVQDCWRMWHLAILVTKRCKEARKQQSTSLARHILHSWVAYIIRARESPQRQYMAIQHRIHITLNKCFLAWNKTLQTWKLNKDEEYNLSAHARRHYRLRMKKSTMCYWLHWLRNYAQPKKRNLANVQVHINKMTMKQAFATWQCIIRVKWIFHMKLDQAKVQHKKWIYIRTMARFKKAIQKIEYQKQIKERGTKFRKLRQGTFVVKVWKRFIQHKKYTNIQRQVAFRHYTNALRQKTFKTWKNTISNQKAERLADREVNRCLMRVAMVFWRDYHVHHLLKMKKIRKAMVYKRRRELKNAKKCLSGWWELMSWRKRTIQLDSLMSGRLRRALLISSLHNWMHATFNGLLAANAKYHDDLVETQSHFEEQKCQVSTVDVENLQLIDRLHSMSAEIAYLKTTINERAQEVEELHKGLEDAAVLEDSMRGEIEQQHMHVGELQNQIRAMQFRIQTKNAEDTTGEVHYTIELQNMEQAIQDLRIQLAERTSQLDAYEKALKETAERLEGASDESQEKLTSAFEIAGSLRKLLEDRDHQYATLEGNSRIRELELGEVQRKLAVTNCTLCETVETRDGRIQELENLLSQKQAEVLESERQLQDLELTLDAKESHVRKLEYEIKLISEPHGVKARKFVSSLSSYAPTPTFTTHCNLFQNPCQHSPAAQPASPCKQQQTPAAPLSPTNMKNTNAAPQVCSPSGRELISCCLSGAPRLQTIEVKESMRHAYAQAKHDLQQKYGARSDECTSPMRCPEHGEMQSLRDLCGTKGETSSHTNQQTTMSNDLIKKEIGSSQALHFQGHNTSQHDWETSFALMSTTRPASVTGGSEPPPYAISKFGNEDQSHGESSTVRVSNNQNVVDSLHVEIQRLQARIMSRLRDPPPSNLQEIR